MGRKGEPRKPRETFNSWKQDDADNQELPQFQTAEKRETEKRFREQEAIKTQQQLDRVTSTKSDNHESRTMDHQTAIRQKVGMVTC
jgi:hypothetical protein